MIFALNSVAKNVHLSVLTSRKYKATCSSMKAYFQCSFQLERYSLAFSSLAIIGLRNESLVENGCIVSLSLLREF